MSDSLPFPIPGVSPEAAQLLAVGLEELPAERLTALVDDIWTAQTLLLGAAWTAALASGRIEPICPDTADQLLDPERVAFRIQPQESA